MEDTSNAHFQSLNASQLNTAPEFLKPTRPAQQSKKIKKSLSSDSLTSDNGNLSKIAEHLQPLKPIMQENPDQFVLSYDQLQIFLENVTGSSDPIAIAKEFTEDIAKLTDMLYQLISTSNKSHNENTFH